MNVHEQVEIFRKRAFARAVLTVAQETGDVTAPWDQVGGLWDVFDSTDEVLTALEAHEAEFSPLAAQIASQRRPTLG